MSLSIADGWNEDDDDVGGGWEDDNDLFGEDDNDDDDGVGGVVPAAVTPATEMIPPRPQQQQPQQVLSKNPKVEKVYQDLCSYVESLPILFPSMNAVLHAEYNTPEKAQELLDYYAERPQLGEYTIRKEIPRMDYQIVQEGGDHGAIIIQDKTEIARLLQDHPAFSLLSRCANQSILADLLQVMTGSDRMVRPQYMATCLAKSCHFSLHPPNLSCQTELVLSLPGGAGAGGTSSGGQDRRYPVATIQASLVFSPNLPNIEFQLHTMKNVLDFSSGNADKLWKTANFLVESGLLEIFEQEENLQASSSSSNQPKRNYRDEFLQQSQNVLANSSQGFKAAWQQMGAVAGIQSKLNLVKKILPSDPLFQAAAAAGTIPDSIPPPTTGRIVPGQQQQQPVVVERPKSILGSMFGRIAKSVALPDEDPQMYQDYCETSSSQRPAQPPPPFPRPEPPQQSLYNRNSNETRPIHPQQPPEPTLTLYHRQEEPAFPKLYLQEEPAVPKLYRKEEPPAPKLTLYVNEPDDEQPMLKLYNDSSKSTSTTTTSNAGHPRKIMEGISSTSFQRKEEESKQSNNETNVSPFSAQALPLGTDGWGDDDLEDGWGDDDDLDDLVADTTIPEAKLEARQNEHSLPPEKPLPSYNPKTDIIETRKRWINPRSGSRKIRSMISS